MYIVVKAFATFTVILLAVLADGVTASSYHIYSPFQRVPFLYTYYYFVLIHTYKNMLTVGGFFFFDLLLCKVSKLCLKIKEDPYNPNGKLLNNTF